MISERAKAVDTSGIRRVFDLAQSVKNPINLSIGQPDFDAFDAVKSAACEAINAGKNGYTTTQGIPELRKAIRKRYGIEHSTDQEVFVTAGVSGGLLLSYLTLLDPGDEILMPDPFFCIYRDLAYMVNAVPVFYDTYPDFSLSVEKLEKVVTKKTKAVVVNSPSNPTGYSISETELDAVVEFAREKDLVLIYDEIYDEFSYDQVHASVLGKYEKTIILNGFSKNAGVPGWRVAWVVAPMELAQHMMKLQQYTLVCANAPAQTALANFFDLDFEPTLVEYRKKRDFIVESLSERFEFIRPTGAFYLFPKAPWGTGQSFVEACIQERLLLVPGNVFSCQDTHFRISFSAPLSVLEQGVEVLNRVAKR